MKRNVVMALLLCAAAAYLYKYNSGASLAVRNGCALVLYPFLRIQAALINPIKAWREQRRDFAQLKRALHELQSKYDTLHAEYVELAAQSRYSQDIAELVAFRKYHQESERFISRVLLREFTAREHSLLIDGGSQQGITLDSPVVYNNMLVGRVIAVYPWYSKVLVITDPHVKIAAQGAASGARGIHEGSGEIGKTLFNFVSHLQPVQEGELLLSSGEGLIFPQGFALGKVKSATHNGLFQDIHVEPLCDVRAIAYCMVLKK
jgi:rod shape-determining protein MreC